MSNPRMDSFAHTPGEYRISRSRTRTPQGTTDDLLDDLLIVYGDSYTLSPILCTVHSDGGRLPVQANAALFALAPDMLRALETLVRRADNGDIIELYWYEMDEARRLVARARGEA